MMADHECDLTFIYRYAYGNIFAYYIYMLHVFILAQHWSDATYEVLTRYTNEPKSV